jgi:hypothetical protein
MFETNSNPLLIQRRGVISCLNDRLTKKYFGIFSNEYLHLTFTDSKQ